MSDEQESFTRHSSLITRHCYFVGEAVFVALPGEAAAAGLAVAWGDGEDAGEAPGEEAGEPPISGGAACRMELIISGLASMFSARLLTIFASFIATSSRAAFRIFLRCSVRACVICWRTPGLSNVRFSFWSCLLCN